jgi:glutaminyl-peptide cyclotransferase
MKRSNVSFRKTINLRIRKMKLYKALSLGLIFSMLIAACGKKSDSTEKITTLVDVPKFNSDSAYLFVQEQVDFGPRIPNSDAHRNTGTWLEQKLKGYGAQVTVQSFKATAFDGKSLELRNIIASFNPEVQKRIVLAAHWDTRPFADKDSARVNATFDGANDGASGVGVLLEIARQLKDNKARTGIDIILFDGEDYGEKYNTTNHQQPPAGWDDWWCLGSQYWSKNKHKPNYRAYYGILLDMVGASDARFFKEATSTQYAPNIVEKVWSAAAAIGYSDFFIKQDVGSITDDHYFVNASAKIPMIDIIHYDGNAFGDFHHTTRDNMSVISKRTLKAVGQTVLQVVYGED